MQVLTHAVYRFPSHDVYYMFTGQYITRGHFASIILSVITGFFSFMLFIGGVGFFLDPREPLLISLIFLPLSVLLGMVSRNIFASRYKKTKQDAELKFIDRELNNV